MKRALPILLFFALCLPITESFSQNNNPKSPADVLFEQFTTDYLEDLWRNNPEWATSVGLHDYDDRISENSITAMETSLKLSDQWYEKMKSIPIQELSTSNKIDYLILENNFKSAHFYFEKYRSYSWDPGSYNLGGLIDGTLNHDKLPLNTRLMNVQKRLAYAPEYFSNAKKQLEDCSAEHCDLAIRQNRGSLWFFEIAFPDSLKASSLSAAEKKQFESTSSKAQKAIESYIELLEKEWKPKANRSPRLGKDLYSEKFFYEIQAGRTADDIYRHALDRKKYLHADMAALSRELWPKYMGSTGIPGDSLLMIKMLIDKISEQHTKAEDYLATIEKQLPELEKFIRERDIITLDETKPLKVRRTPEYMAGVAGASINSPGPFDQNATTYYNVTPLDHYSTDEAESYLREYNDYVLQILNIHEAIPGHYTQLIYANQSPSMIKSIFGNGTMIEGWACYVERMMIEEGYNSSPEMRLFYDKWNLRECTNLLLDYNIHCNNIGEEEALHLLVNEAFQQKAEAKEKYHRALVTNVQLCSYYTGLTEIYELREAYKQKVGAAYSLKKFHEQFLSYGSAPVKYIREMMLH